MAVGCELHAGDADRGRPVSGECVKGLFGDAAEMSLQVQLNAGFLGFGPHAACQPAALFWNCGKDFLGQAALGRPAALG